MKNIILISLTALMLLVSCGIPENPENPQPDTNSLQNTQLSEEEKIKIDTQKIAALQNIKLALSSYQMDNMTYPKTLEELIGIYMVKLPIDPETNTNFWYQKISDTSYILSTKLLSKSHAERMKTDGWESDEYYEVREK